jgi:hypothetical protein
LEYWVFQPQEDITAYELAVIVGKLKKIPFTRYQGIPYTTYDSMDKKIRRHFHLFRKDGVYD